MKQQQFHLGFLPVIFHCMGADGCQMLLQQCTCLMQADMHAGFCMQQYMSLQDPQC